MIRSSLHQKSRSGRRVYEVMGEDGGRPIHRLPHPEEDSKQTPTGRVPYLPPHGLRQQCPLFMHGHQNGVQLGQRGHGPA